MRINYALIGIVLLAIVWGACGQKKQESPPTPPQETTTTSTDSSNNAMPTMTDEDYITYAVEYQKLKNKIQQARKNENFDLIQECQQKMLELDHRYPQAAQYPTTLSQEEQNELGQKLAEAMKEIEE